MKPLKFCSQLWQIIKTQEHFVSETDGKSVATNENYTIQHKF
jgi:hypothetical protein